MKQGNNADKQAVKIAFPPGYTGAYSNQQKGAYRWVTACYMEANYLGNYVPC
jgi:hypothetical protein